MNLSMQPLHAHLLSRTHWSRVLSCLALFFSMLCQSLASPDFGQARYVINEIPDQVAWPDTVLSFEVRSPSPGSPVTFTTNPVPAGETSFDPATNLFHYKPDPADRRPFTVTFAAGSARQALTIEPITALPDAARILTLADGRTAPGGGRMGLSIGETRGATAQLHNGLSRNLRSIRIYGREVVIEKGHANGVYEAYHAKPDLKEVTIEADTLIIRDPIHLPQTKVNLRAEELRFEDKVGSVQTALDTTPLSATERPAQGVDGLQGEKGGDMNVFVKTFVGTGIRFILRGGDGGPGGLGRDGTAGASLSEVGGYGPYGGLGNVWVRYNRVLDRKGDPIPQWEKGVRIFPGDGEDAAAAGAPGNAGAGGTLASNLPLNAATDVRGGHGGPDSPAYVGGAAGLPRTAHHRYYDENPFRGEIFEHSYGSRESKEGANAPATTAAIVEGASGTVVQSGSEWAWFSPYALRASLTEIRAAYINEYFDSVKAQLTALLPQVEGYLASEAGMTAPAALRTDCEQARNEIVTLQHRVEAGQDFWCNPRGWTPLLHLDVTYQMYEMEIDKALRQWYLAYWVGHAASSIEGKIQAMNAARQRLIDEIGELKANYAEALKAVPVLQVESVAIAAKIAEAQARLQTLEANLIAEAIRSAQPAQKKKVPIFQTASKILGVASTVFPQFAPVLGTVAIGLEGFDLLSRVQSQSLWDTIGDVKDLAGRFQELNSDTNVKKYEEAAEDWKARLDSLSLERIKNPGDIIDYVQDLKTNSKPLLEGIQAIRDIITATKVPASVVEVSLAKIKAESPEFRAMADEVATLLARKEAFASQLNATMQGLSNMSDQITANLLSIDALNGSIAQNAAVLDERTQSYLTSMEERAKERLLKYQAYFAKAYLYRRLRPYPAELDMAPLVEKMEEIVRTNSGHILSESEFLALKAVYEEGLSSAVSEIYQHYVSNAPERSGPVRFALFPDEIAKLNAGEALPFDLMKERILPAHWENVRILDLKVVKLGVKTEGVPGRIALLDLAITHSGVSRIQLNGETFRFTHYNAQTTQPVTYGAFYNAVGQVLTPTAPSPATNSLLRAMLTRNNIAATTENVMLFSPLGAVADLVISRSVTSDNGVALTIENVEIEASFEFNTKPSSLSTLRVAVPSEVGLPLVLLSAADGQGLRDARGSFARTYPAGADVELEVQERYGEWGFDRFEDAAGRTLGTPGNRTLRVSLASDQYVQVRFKRGGAHLVIEGDADFGKVVTGKVKSRKFRLVNSGSEDQRVSGLIAPTGFGTTFSGIVPAGGVREITVNFAPKEAGVVQGVLKVTGKEGDSVAELLLRGEGAAPVQFAVHKGIYRGLVNGGVVHAAISATGGLTGKLVFAGAKRTFAGVLDPDGVFVANFPRKGQDPLQLTMHLDLFGDGQLSAKIQDGGATHTVETVRALPANDPTIKSLKGAYTFVASSESTASTHPQGAMIAAINLGANGTTRIKARFPNRVVLTNGGRLSQTHEWLIFAALSGGDTLSGRVAFRDIPQTSDVDGILTWSRTANPGRRSDPAGFSANLLGAGSKYTRPKNGAVLMLPPGSPNATLTLTGNGFDEPLTNLVTLRADNRVRSNGGLPGLNLIITPVTGLIGGRFRHPTTGKIVPMWGAVNQKQGRSNGSFSSGEEHGAFVLEPLNLP